MYLKALIAKRSSTSAQLLRRHERAFRKNMHGNKYYAKLYPVNLKICEPSCPMDNYFSVLSLERIIINN